MLLEDFAKNGRIPVGTSRNGILLSESKRIVVTRSASKESSKGTPPRSSSKETSKGTGVFPGNGNVKEEAFRVPEIKCVLLDTQEDDKDEPKDLLAAMDSFDNLFCRRCLVCTSPFKCLSFFFTFLYNSS